MSITNPHFASMYRLMHEQGHFAGMTVAKYAEDILSLIDDVQADTILDYGSGKGQAWKGVDLNVTCYDPYYPPYSTRPEGQFDLVICSDVMEHVPVEDVPDVLRDIISYASKAVFLAVCVREAKKTLPDGQNAHVTICSPAWWEEKIEAAKKGRPALKVETIYTEE